MPDLRDPIWQGWGAVFGLIAILVTVVAIRYQRGRKNLSYEVVSEVPLLGVKGEVKSKVLIFYDGMQVHDGRLLILKLYNSGNTPIAPPDYVAPVSVTFSEYDRIIDAEVVETEPKNLGASVRVEGRAVIVEPLLLNSGDSVTLKFILEHSTGVFSVNGRIVGVKQIQAAKPRASVSHLLNSQYALLTIMVANLALLVVLLELIASKAAPSSPGMVPVRVFQLLLLVAIIVIAGVIAASKSSIRNSD